MHERDLRRLALESGKTVSRKARARLVSGQNSTTGSGPTSRNNSPRLSPAHSPVVSPRGSRPGSRAASRQGSDDEADFDSDDFASSIASLDLNRFHEFDNAAPEVWQQELDECTEQIIERTRNLRNTAAAREEILAIYCSILQAQFAADEVSPKLGELIPALLKCIKNGSESEILGALRGMSLSSILSRLLTSVALSITIVTTGEEVFEEAYRALKIRISNSTSEGAQASAIHTLGAVTFFGGADITEVEEVMEFLLSIVASDGECVNANDSGPVVTAALQEWGFLATQFADMEDTSYHAMDIFEDQLDSSILSVQIAAGENVALLYEKSFTPLEDDEDRDDEEGLPCEWGAFQRQGWVHRYDACVSGDFALKSKLQALGTSSVKYMAKDNKKDLHRTFKDIFHSCEHPWRGPRYSTAVDMEKGLYLGHRLAVRQGKHLLFTVDRWWKLLRYEAIKRILAGGFITHYKLNEHVHEAIPTSLEAPPTF
jgi:hypothetical protein